jgi:hypothetical protein
MYRRFAKRNSSFDRGVAPAASLGALGAIVMLALGCSRHETNEETSSALRQARGFLLAMDDGIQGQFHTDLSPYTLAEWTATYQPPSEPVVRSFYRNTRELGFWREMVCTKRFQRGGPGGCRVTNWNRPDEPKLQLPPLGTVTMAVSERGFVLFAGYTPNPSAPDDETRTLNTNRVVLDSELEGGFLAGKDAPYVCQNCHGGTHHVDQGKTWAWQAVPDPGSIFREFEPTLLEARPGISRQQAEQEWYELNQTIVAANAMLRSEAQGAQRGVDHAKQAIEQHVHEMYDGLGEPASHSDPPFSRTLDDMAMPPSWRNADPASQALWSKVVNPYCMGCHRINPFDWSRYDQFAYLRDGGAESLLLQYVKDERRDFDVTPRPPPYMPQSEVTFFSMHADADAMRTINAWAGLLP